MLEVFTSFMMLEHLGNQTFDPPTGPAGYERQLDPDRQPFPTKDGAVSIVAYTPDAWDRIFALLEDPAFIASDRYATPRDRFEHSAELYQHIAALTPNFTTAEVVKRCHAAQIPAQPVRDLADVMDDPHFVATGFFRRREHPSEGAYYEVPQPLKFGAMPYTPPRFPPRIDEHGAEIRSEVEGRD